MSPRVDWDARPYHWLKYLKQAKDVNVIAHDQLVEKLDKDDLAIVKWAVSIQQTDGNQQQAYDTGSLVFLDLDEQPEWQDHKAFLASWNHSLAKAHRDKLRKQRREMEEREKGNLALASRSHLTCRV
ncbi:hypothetical protein ColLi_12981 [Colletotrichum liriopes]|uniref:Uncharacterized protein n=1 Tax=Colletotrichum liriopes TaxID=708192 RepID=A0AA37H212_9PEZI|nr:hypothetical protein ColLi_12981 [Colletotrichum liriopes]